MGRQFTAAVVQMSSGVDCDANITAMQEGIRQAVEQGADYVQTPEMTGLVQQDRQAFFATVKGEDEDPVHRAARDCARQFNVAVHLGSTPILVEEGKAVNRSYLYDKQGDLIARYDKIHMFDVDLDQGESWRESATYRAGTKAVIAPVLGHRFGLAICYDCRFPELYSQYARSGVEVLTGPSCFTRQTGQAHWHILLRARAIENGAYMIAAAQGGDLQDGRSCYGHSLIINPWGKVIAEVCGEKPGVALARIDCDEVTAARSKIPNLTNHRPFSIEKVQ